MNMPRFAYTAIETRSGAECQGFIECRSQAEAAAGLKSSGFAPTALTLAAASTPGNSPRNPTRPAFWSVRRRAISRTGLVALTRQLATLVKAGLPIHRALAVLARAERRPACKAVLDDLSAAIVAGSSLSDGLQCQPRIFDRLYVHMVKAGEAGGVLDAVLDRLARLLERTERIRSRVKAAMTYPVVILLVAAGILAGLGIFVVPKFEQIFQGLLRGQALPLLTRCVLGAGNFASHHIAVLAGGILVGWQACRVAFRSRVGVRVVDRILISAPVVGDLFLKAAIARFSRAFGSLLASGVPMLDALAITRDACGNVHLIEALASVQAAVRGGAAVAGSLQESGIFPHLVTSMVEVGEETGALPEMLARIADTYDEELDIAVSALTSILEPIMIVLMALVVGVVVLALFLPIVGVIQHL